MSTPSPTPDPLQNAGDAAAENLRRFAEELENSPSPPLPNLPPPPPLPDLLKPTPKPPPSATPLGSAKNHALSMKLMGVGFNFVGSVVGGMLLGWLIDRWLNSSPYATLGFFAVGLAGGLVMLFREAR